MIKVSQTLKTQGANINKSDDLLKIYSKLIDCDIDYSISFNQVLDKYLSVSISFEKFFNKS